MSELIDRTPMESYGDMFITTDLRLCLEGAVRAGLAQSVRDSFMTQEEADTQYEAWLQANFAG